MCPGKRHGQGDDTMTLQRQLRVGAAFLMLAAGAVLSSAQSAARLPADLDPDSRARLAYLKRKDLNERSQNIFDTLPGRSAEGVLRGPLAFASYNPGVDEKDATVIRFGRQMLHEGKMDSATFAKAAQLFGKRGTMDLVAVMSTRAVRGFFAIAVDEHMPPGRADLESTPRQ